ncbi:MAG TPA: tRNA pseudouridine(13) synthase TruD [Anaeromyxobacteraceae bacterium]|nr:tRNA pseudouridine(13) synthase TruD [Anaeromyxobacteraceae bacterium]
MNELPLVTGDLPGSGGTVKATPDDFRVDEVPAYEPAGAGAHLYLHVEKTGRTTRDVVAALARALGVPERDAGYAGLKDRQAVTTQWLSFPVARDPDPSTLAGEGYRVLAASRHGNKLKPGHSRGNVFALRVRGGDAGAALACAAALAERGLPNFFGAQRFGREGRNADVGRALLLGRDDPETRRASRDRFLRRLSISAWQSALFNRWLAERIADGIFAEAIAGDVMKKLETGGLFTCDDPAADSPRVKAFEISPTGPMFGHSMREAAGEAGARESRVLAGEGIGAADLARGRGEAEGTRRAARLRVDVEVVPLEEGYLARFMLPKGSYATVVLRELTRSEGSVPEDD